ncbi:MAG: Rieske (2Fe-2S) protein [Actinobacteria bacterium]|nr:Rieske (2Fe-2S) protein [Actinomycetota bacterium]
MSAGATSTAARGRPLVRHYVGTVEEFEPDRFRTFEIEGRPVGVVRTAAGFFACRNRCPHQGADICAGAVSVGTMVPSQPMQYVYSADRCIVACPWHRWEFDLRDGEGIQGITKKRLVTYAVEVDEDGRVAVLMRGRKGAGS